MASILVRHLSASTLDALKQRAKRNRRSLQQEVLSILDSVTKQSSRETAAEIAVRVRSRLAVSGRVFGDSAALVREDRER